MSKKIEIINGPNLNLLGKREPDIYGKSTLEEINKDLSNYAKKIGLDVSFFQSNIEGEIVNQIQQSEKTTHTDQLSRTKPLSGQGTPSPLSRTPPTIAAKEGNSVFKNKQEEKIVVATFEKNIKYLSDYKFETPFLTS